MTRLAGWFAERERRANLHILLLVVLATVLLGYELTRTVRVPYDDLDKRYHFHAGRILGLGLFVLVYPVILVRVGMASREGQSLFNALLWIPSIIAVIVLCGFLMIVAIALCKEFLDVSGGTVEWADVVATGDGLLTLVPSMAVIMAVTPVLIPIDLLMQVPQLVRSDLRLGVGSLDQYVRARKEHGGKRCTPAVLLVEDDIVCATAALRFCEYLGLNCRHVETIRDAEVVLEESAGTLRLMMLDNFVRVDRRGKRETGSEWLETLCDRYPKGGRSFIVALISGHTHLLGERAELADIVLQKPWKPSEFLGFLRERGVIGELEQ